MARGIAARWYGSVAWKRRRKAQLAEHPLCAMCLERGHTKPANVADHIIPHRGDHEKFWNGKLQSLCFTCHNSDKQKMERPKAIIPGEDGWPIHQ